MEVDRRDSAIDLAYPSLFAYCVRKLGYSEAAAFSRIRAARAAANFPEILTRLRSGSLHLESIVRLYPYLNEGNSRELLTRAEGASKREVLSLVAQLQTEPGAQRDMIIPVPAGADDALPSVGECASKQDQAAPELVRSPRHRFHFTADGELLELVERLRGLLRHKIPDGRLELIFKEAADSLLRRLERDKWALPHSGSKPTSNSTNSQSIHREQSRRNRIVPRAVKRAVWTRDGGRCVYTAGDGRRCESRDALEYDHILAWSDGGRSDTQDNIRLLCRTHNQRLGRRRFGPRRRR